MLNLIYLWLWRFYLIGWRSAPREKRATSEEVHTLGVKPNPNPNNFFSLSHLQRKLIFV